MISNGFTVKRNTLMVYLLVDCSGSMKIDNRMDVVDRMIEQTIGKIRELSGKSDKVDVAVSAIIYANKVAHLYGGPVSVDKFFWYQMEANNGSSMGLMLKELKSALEYAQVSAYDPMIIMFNDGMSTDLYQDELRSLTQMESFVKAQKIGVFLGDEHQEDIEAIIGAENIIDSKSVEVFSSRLEACIEHIKSSGIVNGVDAAENLNIMDSSEMNENSMTSDATEENGENTRFMHTWSPSDWE